MKSMKIDELKLILTEKDSDIKEVQAKLLTLQHLYEGKSTETADL